MLVQRKPIERGLWGRGRLGDFFSIQQGKQISKKNRVGENQHPFLRTSNVFWGKLELDHLDHMHFTADEEKRFKLQDEDLLVCEGGDVGRTAMWHDELDRCYYQNHLHRLRRISDDIDSNFTLFWLQYSFLYSKIYLGRANITTIPNLSKSRLGELEISLPPLSEQKKIVQVLQAIQNAITEQEKLIARLKELKRSMMQHLFTHGTKGEKTKMTEIGEIPESWDVLRLGDVCHFSGGTQPPKANFISTPKVGYIRLLQIRDYQSDDKAVYIPDNKRWCRVSESDVLIGRYGASVGKILRGHEGVINVAIMKTDPNESLLLKSYLYYLLNTRMFQDFITGVGGRSAQAGFNQGEIGSFEIPLPSVKEQKVIANGLEVIDVKIDVLGSKVEVYQNLFKTLLHELMSGERRV